MRRGGRACEGGPGLRLGPLNGRRRGRGERVEAADQDIEQRVRDAIEAHNEIRRDMHGGCGWSQHRIDGGTVYLATTDHDNEPELVILPVAEFLAQWEAADDDEDGEE